MKCPDCGKEMELGRLQSAQQIAWLPGKKRALLSNRAERHEGAVVLSQASFWRGSAVEAYLCRDCERVVIDYKDGKSDFNRRKRGGEHG